MRILVTGANGFVGQALCRYLDAQAHVTVPAVRRGSGLAKEVVVGDIDGATDWGATLAGCDAVVHLAARVHVMQDDAADPLAMFRRVNVEATLNLARQAAQAGVRRLVFLGSIKVNGEGREEAYREADAPDPQDAYAVSKWEAEQGLMAIAQETGMEVVILRPPLVYGPRVGANFLRLLQLVERGVPLPFGAIDNRRSLLYLGNLVDAIALCLTHPAAANQTFLVSDGEDISTPALIRKLAAQMDKPARLWPVPGGWLALAGRLVGKGSEVQRLLGSLVVDSGKIRSELGWRPPFTQEQGLAETVRWYLDRKSNLHHVEKVV